MNPVDSWSAPVESWAAPPASSLMPDGELGVPRGDLVGTVGDLGGAVRRGLYAGGELLAAGDGGVGTRDEPGGQGRRAFLQLGQAGEQLGRTGLELEQVVVDLHAGVGDVAAGLCAGGKAVLAELQLGVVLRRDGHQLDRGRGMAMSSTWAV